MMTGKVELGTGVSTALRQIVAEELDFPFEKINWIQGDTANTVDQAPTFGSQTIKRGGGQLRQAAAEAKATLLSLASARLGVPTEQLIAAQGVISDPGNPKKKMSYADLIGGQHFNRDVTGKLRPKSTTDIQYRWQARTRVSTCPSRSPPLISICRTFAYPVWFTVALSGPRRLEQNS